MNRRSFLSLGGALTVAALARGQAAWDPDRRYPDALVRAVDPSFNKYRIVIAKVERIATGNRWCEGPVWMGDQRLLLWSDIPHNRVMKWEEQTGAVSVHAEPCNNANGHTRDRQGRLLTCEASTCRVVRTEYDGSQTVIAERFDGKRLNSPNDIICKSDDSIWFSDPYTAMGRYGGYVGQAELPSVIYRWDPKTKALAAVASDITRPNGLAFSPDESKLYVVDSASTPHAIRVYDVVGGTRLAQSRVLLTAEANGTPDGLRVDVDGNLWVGWGMGDPKLDGVSIFNPDGRLIGRIDLPERCSNVCFGGVHRNRLFMAASTSIYSLYVNTQGAVGG
jgi:gluconolactonase